MNKIKRKFILALAADDLDVSRNIAVVLDIVGTLPLISMAQHSSGSASDDTMPEEITYDRSLLEVYINTPLESEMLNHPVDPDLSDRFTPITIIASAGTGFNYYLYHDSKYNDMIMLPNLRHIGDAGDSVNYFKNAAFNLTGHRVGTPITPSAKTTLTYPAGESLHNIPIPVSLIDNKIHQISLFNKLRTPIFDGVMLTSDRALMTSTALGSFSFVSLGGSSRLFDANVNINRVIECGYNQMMLRKVPLAVNVNDIMIPLP